MNVVNQYEERAVLVLVAQGDEDAFEILFHQYRHRVLYLGWKFLQSDAKAQDILQEVFLKVWMSREQLPEIKNFKAWLSAITRNQLFNALRRRAVEDAYTRELASKKDIPSVQNTVLDDLSFNDLQYALQRAVSHLTPQQKKIFELSRIEGLKHEQIAEKLEMSRETVKKHMTDALRKIRVQMRSHETMIPLGILLLTVNF